jgi:hypothetical protein
MAGPSPGLTRQADNNPAAERSLAVNDTGSLRTTAPSCTTWRMRSKTDFAVCDWNNAVTGMSTSPASSLPSRSSQARLATRHTRELSTAASSSGESRKSNPQARRIAQPPSGF